MKMHKSLQKIDSVVFSDYILKHYGTMSHLKLQKLIFTAMRIALHTLIKSL